MFLLVNNTSACDALLFSITDDKYTGGTLLPSAISNASASSEFASIASTGGALSSLFIGGVSASSTQLFLIAGDALWSLVAGSFLSFIAGSNHLSTVFGSSFLSLIFFARSLALSLLYTLFCICYFFCFFCLFGLLVLQCYLIKKNYLIKYL